jgi:hypothetical protein
MASSWEQSAPPSEDLLIPFFRTDLKLIRVCKSAEPASI